MTKFNKLLTMMLLAASSMFVLSSCMKDDATLAGSGSGSGGDTPPPADEATLTVSPTALIFTAEAGTKTVTVTTNQENWKGETTAAWLSVTQSGNTLTVAAEANTEETLRQGTITFTAGEATPVSFVVAQEAPAAEDAIYIYPSTTMVTLGGMDTDPVDVLVDTNAESINVIAANDDFFEFTTTNDKITISAVDYNASFENLIGTITLSAGDKSIEITVMQTPGILHSAGFDMTGTWEVYSPMDKASTPNVDITWTTNITKDEVRGGFLMDNFADLGEAAGYPIRSLNANMNDMGFYTDNTDILFVMSSRNIWGQVFVQSLSSSTMYLSTGTEVPIYVSADGTAMAMSSSLIYNGLEYAYLIGIAFLNGTSTSYYGNCTFYDLQWTKAGTTSVHGTNVKTFGNTVFRAEPINMSMSDASKVTLTPIPESACVTLER
jgi:hypothetical protein